jgi:hypothetical protein
LGDFATLPEAVTWFNSSALGPTELVVDGVTWDINDTIVVNNPSYALKVTGIGYDLTTYQGATGLSGKPMFNLQSECYFKQFMADGTTLAGYGTGTDENCFTFGTPDIYCEFDDCSITGFNTAIYDPVGVSYFIYNFDIDSCVTGLAVNYSNVVAQQTIDAEIGNFNQCTTGINLARTGTGGQNFILTHLVFSNNSGSTSFNYTGVTTGVGYYYGLANIINCSTNNLGNFRTGFDFSNSARDANIEILGCVGTEDAKPHAKINVRDNVTSTSLGTIGTYYKVNFTNGQTYSCKINTTTNNRLVYLSSHPYDVLSILSGNVALSSSSANLTFVLRKELYVTTLTRGSATGTIATATTATPHHLRISTAGNIQVQMLGWTSAGTISWNGVKSLLSTPTPTTFTYTITYVGTATAATGGTGGALFSPMTVRATSTNSYAFTMIAYIEEMTGYISPPAGGGSDYVELYMTNESNAISATVQDVNWVMHCI